MEEVDAADGHRPQGVAMVGVAQADEGGAPPVLTSALLPVLKGHLQGDLGRARARVRVEDAIQPGRGEVDQARRQLGRAAMGEAEHRRVGNPVELLAHRLVDQGMTMAVDVAPQRRDAVDVAVSLRVHQLGALGALDHERLFAAPVPLLGERVPEVALVELADGRGERAAWRLPIPHLNRP